MRIIDIMLKDLTQILRDKKSLLFLLAMPLVFTLFMGLAFNDASKQPDPRLPVGWINQDGAGMLSQALHGALTNSDSLRLVEIAPDQEADANRQVNKGQLAGALIVPAGFSQQMMETGKGRQISLIIDPASVTGQSVLELVRVPVTRLMSSVEIATLHMAALPADHANSSERDATLQLSSTLWNQAAQAGPQITMIKAEGAAAAGAPLGGNPYNQSSPGMLVMFAIFSLGTSAMIFVQERTSRTLERMLTTSLKRASLIAGHLLAMAVLVFAQQAVLVLFGQLALKVNYFHDPLGVLLVMIGVALWSASMGLLIGVVARNEQRVTLYTLVTMFLFSAIGGVWFPLEGSGTAFTTIGKLTPGAWAMTGFQNILIRGLGLTSVVLPAAILLGYAVLFFSLAAWRFQKKQA